MFKKDKNLAGLETVIGLVTEELELAKPGSPEFDKIAEQLERLNKIASSRKSAPVSKDGLIAVVANLAGIGFILKFEQLHTLTTKAIGFVAKSRI